MSAAYRVSPEHLHRVALVEHGSDADTRFVHGVLATIAESCREQGTTLEDELARLDREALARYADHLERVTRRRENRGATIAQRREKARRTAPRPGSAEAA